MTQAISHILDEVEQLSDAEQAELQRLILNRHPLPETSDETAHILQLAGRVYHGLSSEQIAEVEKIALTRRDFFDRNAA